MIRIGICGYGNLGRGAEAAVNIAQDMTLVGIFTRRNSECIETDANIYSMDDLMKMKDSIDVLLMCGGSATDLPVQSVEYAEHFNIVDSYDNHAHILSHIDRVNESARRGGRTAIVSTGWDPGLFSLNRLYGQTIIPNGESYTFWGRGVSQGHSDAVRRIAGVKTAVQYTVPVEEAINGVRTGQIISQDKRSLHRRICYVVMEEGGNPEQIEESIKTMPDYFEPYDTEVNFIDEETFNREHGGMPHGGFVMRSGELNGHKSHYEFSLNLESNPYFTASLVVAYGRGAYRMNKEGMTGAKTVFEVPPYMISPVELEVLIEGIL